MPVLFACEVCTVCVGIWYDWVYIILYVGYVVYMSGVVHRNVWMDGWLGAKICIKCMK